MMDQLNVYLCNRLAGVLQREPNGSLTFRYLPEYIASEEATPLSSTLPLEAEPFGERDIAAFFSNLLPDESVRRRIADILRLSTEDTFGLLREIGCDCAGAIAFYEPPRKPNELAAPVFRKLSDSEAATLLRNLANRPLGIDEEFRGISGAGAQDKLIACLKDGKVLLPLHGTPSTHIFKPNIDRFPDSVFNEWFCMKLSKACGFDTAECDILTFGGDPFYVTRRYDREELAGIVYRLHQEDFCQLLKCRPEIKYQDQGGPSIVECTKLLLSMRLPLSDVISFVNRCIFNFIIGNGDAHGKNFSILYRNGTPRLAPVYDIICTAVYPSIAKKMAMKYDGKFEFRWITPGKIARTFARAGIRENVVMDAISRQCAFVKDNLPRLVDEANASHPSAIYHDIVQGIHRRIRQLNI
ncbi:MAG: type II toxin-antitoxin system HipA family toxin [Kiritimatiellae bacterium]|nr:type II toxin-antitoxin system HipA family toxin [Kiritimatiellia bacterium]